MKFLITSIVPVLLLHAVDQAYSWGEYYNPRFQDYQFPLSMQYPGQDSDSRYYIHQDPPRPLSSMSNNAECKSKDPQANKRVAMGFYQDVWGNKQFDHIHQYLDKDVINHNPHEVNGTETVLEMLKGPMGDGPPVKVQFQRVSAEDDLVWMHVRLPIPAVKKVYAIVDIFRIGCNGLVVEKWDVMQDTDVETKNPVAFF